MRLKISSIVEYTSLLLKKYNELHQSQENNIYRIIEIRQSSSGQYKVIIQVVGKSSIIECSPQEIVTVDWLLEGFSKKDIRIITYYACEQTKNPKYKIKQQELTDQNKMLFLLDDIENKKTTMRSAAQIILDDELINHMSKEDIKRVSYMAGYESCQHERSLMKQNK